jgi:hypothetical protein
MIRLACHVPNPHDATAWYRAVSPLAHMRKRGFPVQYDLIREWSAPAVMGYDAAFFQRPCTAPELEAIRICKRLSIPVIVDYDDLLFDLPVDNPAYQHYMNQETQSRIVTIMREADCLWVSTRELKRCIQLPRGGLNDKVYVVPNALDDVHMVTGSRGLPPPVERRQGAVVWRGSATHEQDIMTYAKQLAEAAEASPKTSFVFVGYNPWFLTKHMRPKQAVVSGAMPVGEFMDFLYATAARVGVVPLHPSRFNLCKSNIAWLEMTWAGGVVLAPDWEEWRQPGVVTYRDEDGFKAGLMALTAMEPAQLEELHRMSWNHIVKRFTLSAVNPIRQATLTAALGRSEWPEGHQRIEDPDEAAMELE